MGRLQQQKEEFRKSLETYLERDLGVLIDERSNFSDGKENYSALFGEDGEDDEERPLFKRTDEAAHDCAILVKSEAIFLTTIAEEIKRIGENATRNMYGTIENGAVLLFPLDNEREIQIYRWQWPDKIKQNISNQEDLRNEYPTFCADQKRKYERSCASTAQMPAFFKGENYFSYLLSHYMQYVRERAGPIVSLNLSELPVNGTLVLPEGIVSLSLENIDSIDGLRIPKSVQYLREAEIKPIQKGLVKISDSLRDSLKKMYERNAELRSERATLIAQARGEETETDRSIEAQLLELFPKTDPRMLEQLIEKTNTQFRQIEKITDKTCSDAIISYRLKGSRVYCKISKNKRMLQKEAQYHFDAWSHPILRPITPKIAGIIETKDAAGLITYDARDATVVSEKDHHKYQRLRKDILGAYKEHIKSMRKNSDRRIIGKEELIDIFNRSLSHAHMKDHREEEIYQQEARPLVLPFEIICDRAARGSDKVYRQIAGIQSKYTEAERVVQDYEATVDEITIINGNPTDANIFTKDNRRVLGDYGFATRGSIITDLAQFETGNDDACVSAYLFMRQEIEKRRGEEFVISQKRGQEIATVVGSLSFLHAARTYSHHAEKGNTAQQRRYGGLLGKIMGSSF